MAYRTLLSMLTISAMVTLGMGRLHAQRVCLCENAVELGSCIVPSPVDYPGDFPASAAFATL